MKLSFTGLKTLLIKQVFQKTLILLIGLLIFHNSASSQQKIVGYYESWSNLTVDKIEFKNLTHIVHAFAWPDTDGTLGFSSNVPNPALVTAVHNANEKILISFTNDSTDGFSKILSDSNIRALFISNVVKFLTTNKYDGIDFDWEYPTKVQTAQLTELIKEIRQSFNSTDSTWLISMAIPPNSYYAGFYDLKSMAAYVDWFSAMTYNFHGSWSTQTGHNAPLYKPVNESDLDDSTSIQYMLTTRNIPASKLLMGVAFYGMQFNSKGLYKPFTPPVNTVIYSEIMDTVSSGKWTYYWDSVSKVPYYLSNDTTKFITFDDTVSMRLKTEFSISKKLGGIMIWALGLDGTSTSQPLLEAIGKATRDNVTAVIQGGQSQGSNLKSFYLYNNYPNPFNPSTQISWNLNSRSFVRIKIYDLMGNEITSLVNQYQNSGLHSIEFSSRQARNKTLASGIYFYQLVAGNFVSTKKMMYLK
jgi:chitinase